MNPTFNITDVDLIAALSLSFRDANRVQVQDDVLLAASPFLYESANGNWRSGPLPQVWVQGEHQDPASYTLDLVNGTVTFTTPPDPDAVVTASYWFTLFADADYQTFLNTGFTRVENGIAVPLDDTAVPRQCRPALLAAAHLEALRTLLAPRLDGYLWRIEGRTVDRRQVSQRYTEAMKLYEQQFQNETLGLRMQFMAEGGTVYLTIDKGMPPSPYSTVNNT